MASEFLQFGGALVLFLSILIGSYWFVYAPTGGTPTGGTSGEEKGRG